MTTQTYTGTLSVFHCCNCGVPFGITADFEERRRKDHEWFYCPAGHSQHFTSKTEAERLKDDLAREKHRAEQARAALADLRSSLNPEVAQVAEEAKRYRDNKRLLSAFWNGASVRNCGALPSDCPYQSGHFGFRAAWFAGAGIEEAP